MSVVNLPRFTLGHWPTPLQPLERLSEALGGPKIWMKRDDLTGMALGGNKCRKLEYVIADAKQKGVDALITTGSSQSNFALQMAVAARMAGMEPYSILVKGEHVEIQGNLLLHNILDSSVEIVDAKDPSEMFTIIPQKMEALAERLKLEGSNPMLVPAGASFPIGTAGWVNAAEELNGQLAELGLNPKHAVLATGSGGTHAGLMLGLKSLNSPVKVIGMSVFADKQEASDTVKKEAELTAELLGLNVAFEPDDVIVSDDYLGDGYGIPTEAGVGAIRLLAQLEGVFLDPVYSAKAMAGLMDRIEKGDYQKDDTVVFIHTGGVTANFAYRNELSNYKSTGSFLK